MVVLFCLFLSILVESKLPQVLFSPAYFKNKILSHILRVRIPATVGHAKVRNFIVARLKHLGFSVELDVFHDRTPFYESLEFTNIVATHNLEAKNRLVLACHYDSKYYEPENGRVFIGAIDSAVSCSMLLYLAEMLVPYLKKDTDKTLQLIFFDGEEAFQEWTSTDSLYGSRHLAKEFSQTYLPHSMQVTKMDAISLFILLDLIGYKNPKFHSLYRNSEPHFKALVDIERKQYPHSKEFIFQDPSTSHMYGHTVGDDQVPFVEAGVTCIHLIPLEFPAPWHTFDDTESIVDYESVHKIQLILFEFIKKYLNN